MRKTLLLLLFIALVVAGGSYTQTQFEERTGASELELARNWQLLAVIALVVSAILVAIAYAIGTGFEMPEIKAWANSEMVQIVANLIIIILLLVTIVFIDAVVLAIVSSSGVPVTCVPGQSCLQNVTDAYLADYVEMARVGAKDTLRNNVDAASLANMRFGIYCTTYYCAQLGIMFTVAAGYILDQDMYSILFEYHTNLLSSMEAQKFFVDEISFRMGPVILAIGIVARSFFFTRKLGGLLIAIAAGIMFFLPGMYVFDWMTLDMTTNADKIINSKENTCPPECSVAAPIAYIEGGRDLKSIPEVKEVFSFEDADIAQEIIEGTRGSATSTNGTDEDIGRMVVSCAYPSNFTECPVACRELPYPAISQCLNKSPNVQLECSKVPDRCRVKRLVDTSAPTFDAGEYAQCPAACKIVPPMKSNCSVGNCLDSRFDCRVAKRTDLSWRPEAQDAGNKAACDKAIDCPASLTASDSCTYVIPETGRCDELCAFCPAHCRLEGAELNHLPEDCKNNETDPPTLLAACQECVETCKVDLALLSGMSPPAGTCAACVPERRLIYSPLPPAYLTDNASDPAGGMCSLTSCPADYRLALPRSTCESCLFTEESYGYDPPINVQCTDVCAPTADVPAKSPGEYTKIGAEGLVGKSEIQAVAKLMIPAYLLPLFNIVATLIFIRGLSGMLGGDIEIPGLTKVF